LVTVSRVSMAWRTSRLRKWLNLTPEWRWVDWVEHIFTKFLGHGVELGARQCWCRRLW
jgi:hypothetical protein